MSTKVVPNELEANRDVARVLLLILKSREGREIFRKSIQSNAKDIVQGIDSFFEKNRNAPFLTDTDRMSLNDAVKRLSTLLNNFPDENIDFLLREMQEKFSIGQIFLVEGYFLAMVEFFRDQFKDYYNLVNLQYTFRMKETIGDLVVGLFSEQELANGVGLKQFFPKIEGFKSIDPAKFDSLELEKRVQLIKNNGDLIKKNLIYLPDSMIDLTFFKQRIRFNPQDKNSVKELEKFKKKISEKIRDKDFNCEEANSNVDGKITDMIEATIYALTDYRKRTLPKDLQKNLANLLASGGWSLF